MLPILDRELPAQRIDLYQSSADQRHPLAAAALVNDGETGVPPGVLTLYEQTTVGGAFYLGDARLAAFPPGEKRMMSYAVDAKVTVDRSNDEQHAIVSKGRHRARGDAIDSAHSPNHDLSGED